MYSTAIVVSFAALAGAQSNVIGSLTSGAGTVVTQVIPTSLTRLSSPSLLGPGPVQTSGGIPTLSSVISASSVPLGPGPVMTGSLTSVMTSATQGPYPVPSNGTSVAGGAGGTGGTGGATTVLSTSVVQTTMGGGGGGVGGGMNTGTPTMGGGGASSAGSPTGAAASASSGMAGSNAGNHVQAGLGSVVGLGAFIAALL